MIDPFGRTIDYLRISVTDRCNFRCVYCMPEDGVAFAPREELLTFEEIARLVAIFVRLGISKIRLTGGEPLVRKELHRLVADIAALPGVRDLSLTTNGLLLGRHAGALAQARLHRVNVSLDTLRPERFAAICRGGDLGTVLNGIRAARDAGLAPIKLNVVSMRGVNDDEAPDFAAWTLREEVHVRFIELMPIRWNLDEVGGFEPEAAFGGERGLIRIRQGDGGMLSDGQMRRMTISSAELRSHIEETHGQLAPAELATNGPARTYRLSGAPGTVGFISQISNDLCSHCNRLRLTSDGFLRPCLMADGELSLRDSMREGAPDERLEELILHVVAHKPERHYLAEGQRVTARSMSQIGG
ncbi:MAG: GTP 3',8-cyclase MoaA [Fimbriimonas ginsengisoli]|uniref:GTP 3',8-cyclase n=1 Tax=Fimbriimonas ginsengisoli TaxID=1005039 RepID=A0A931LWU9_FIMGI|nr:GTP 3',8-cyclase MoaA [Fimbriimonas ginsengisoli]